MTLSRSWRDSSTGYPGSFTNRSARLGPEGLRRLSRGAVIVLTPPVPAPVEVVLSLAASTILTVGMVLQVGTFPLQTMIGSSVSGSSPSVISTLEVSGSARPRITTAEPVTCRGGWSTPTGRRVPGC